MPKGMRVALEVVEQGLHDRVTRGETLTETEQTALRAWYDAQDAAERISLQAAPTVPPDTLRADVDAALARLQEVTQGLQRLSEENAALRRENAALTRRLAQTTQAA